MPMPPSHRKKLPLSQGIRFETFDEAGNANTSNAYIATMAEKCALSRAALKLSGFYKHGAYGENEFDQNHNPMDEYTEMEWLDALLSEEP
jgi:hypothetical protein